jgi:hypothetical protein
VRDSRPPEPEAVGRESRIARYKFIYINYLNEERFFGLSFLSQICTVCMNCVYVVEKRRRDSSLITL